MDGITHEGGKEGKIEKIIKKKKLWKPRKKNKEIL